MTDRFRWQVGIALLMLLPAGAQAAEATVVLDVHNAGCVLCGPILKGALSRVDGVRSISIVNDGTTDVMATIVYDDTLTAPRALIQTATDQGYPSEVARSPNG